MRQLVIFGFLAIEKAFLTHIIIEAFQAPVPESKRGIMLHNFNPVNLQTTTFSFNGEHLP